MKTIDFPLIKIKNRKLAGELEKECKEKFGFLTYSEYLQIEQFGQNGYHSNSSFCGATKVHRNWSKALAVLCQNMGYDHVIEFGPGNGDLAIKLIKESKKTKNEVTWSGIEINTKLHQKIKERFKKEEFEENFKEIVASVDDLNSKQKCLIIFPYSLDSIPPEIFVNTDNKKSFPNATIGVKVNNGILNEVILNQDLLAKRSMSLKEGIYSDNQGKRFDLTSWELNAGQRAYIPINAFSTLADYANKLSSKSQFIVIDEFRKRPFPWQFRHLCLPRNLYARKRDCRNLEKNYKNAGRNLFYHTTYLDTFFKFLHSLGFESIRFDIEQKISKELTNSLWFPFKKNYHTYAFIFSNKKRQAPDLLKIEFPKRRLI